MGSTLASITPLRRPTILRGPSPRPRTEERAGEARSRQSRHAFLYSGGQMMDLNDLIDRTLGITLYDARGISNNGQIVADHYLLTPILTPVPEPSTLALFGVALLGLTVWARR